MKTTFIGFTQFSDGHPHPTRHWQGLKSRQQRELWSCCFIFLAHLVIIAVIGIPIGFTQEVIENPQWHLPEGAIARLGKGTVNGLTYSPDGTQLVIVSSIGIWVYDAQTGVPLRLFTGHTDIASSVAYSPAGSTIASGSWDNTIRLWGPAHRTP